MKLLYKTLYCLILTASLSILQSCKDELPGAEFYGGDLEGDCWVSLELQGLPLEAALSRTSGDAINTVDNLYVLFYSTDGLNGNSGELSYAFTTDQSCANTIFDKSLSIASSTMQDRADWSESEIAEAFTPKVTTSKIQVGRGKYLVYVVANIEAFSASGFTRDEILTPSKLRNYNLSWNETEVKSNNALFGFFTLSSTEGYDVINEDAPELMLGGEGATLHAWVKRAASKVTVAFDGSELNDNVNIYIKNVSIKDIPLHCKLGTVNTPTSTEELLAQGEKITYDTNPGLSTPTRISSKEPYFPNFTGYTDDAENVARWRENVHSETANALYFYENCQGKASGLPDANGSWKQQTDLNGNGKPDDYDNGILKDTKAFGSYIEVEAYYTNENFGEQTEGKIIYRFMLGMNTTDDFNSHRNNHYKLTLRFKNHANNVDWHIDYNDEPGIYIPDIIYVSYTYNTPSHLPIRVVGQTVSDLSVTINSSNWYPDDSTIPYYTGTTNPTGLATGFLSLTYDANPRIPSDRSQENFNATLDAPLVKNYWDNQPNNSTRQYISNGQKVNWTDLDIHGYNVDTRITSEGETVFEANIPMFTRPLVIFKICSWTGANPYYSSERSAEVTVSGTIDGKVFSKKVQVKQVRRVENPAGIYRRHDNSSPFHVVLMERAGEGGTHSIPVSYSPLISRGAWRAIIYRTTTGTVSSSNTSDAQAWFNITAGSQRVSQQGSFIQGDSDTPIDFTYTPNGTIGINDVRSGIIKVEYNDYTCTHYIFVRQGYAPMQLESGKVFWHSFNLYSGNEETKHPCEAGSQFIRGYWSPAILDSNDATYGWGVSTSSLAAIINEAGTTSGNVSIPLYNSGSYVRKDFQAGVKTLSRYDQTITPWNSGRVPTLTEWSTLLNEVANAQVDRAFGVLYADGATATQTSPDEVYGCVHTNISSGTSSRGMRGTFVYNTGSGRNLFFPIGASGYGRRKVGANGQLQYGYGDTFWSTPLSSATRAPLYNLYTNEGAIYWAQSAVTNQPGAPANVSTVNAWDINYKSYDFDYMDQLSNNTPTAFIRLVQDNAP